MGLFVNLGLTTSYAALLSGGGGGGSGDANFGALTLAGAGGVAKPAPSTSISDDGGTNLTITGGMVVPDTGGFGTAGTVVFNDGTEWTVTATADTYSVLADQAEIEAAAADAPLSSTRTIQVRDGTATGDRVDLTGLVFTGGLTVQSTGWGAEIPGFDLTGSSKITLSALNIARLWSATEQAASPTLEQIIVRMANATDCHITGNIIAGDDMDTQNFVEKDGVTLITGVGTSASESMTNCTITSNIMRDLRRPIRCTGCADVRFDSNTVTDCYANFGEMHGEDVYYRYNRCSGLWAHGGGNTGAVGPNNPFSGARWKIPVASSASFADGENITQAVTGETATVIGRTTGFLWIDGPNWATTPLGNGFDATNTITGDISGSTTPTGLEIPAFPYDWGDPHSSLFGTGGQTTNGHTLIGNIMIIGPNRKNANLPDINGLVQDYGGIGSGGKWNDPTDQTDFWFSNVTIMHNIFSATDGLGLQIAYLRDSEIAFNTLFADEGAPLNTIPAINYSYIGPNVSMHHNVSTGFATTTDAPGLGVDDSFFELSHENILARPNGMSTTISGHPTEYSQLFDGPTFSDLTIAQIVPALQIKSGGRLDKTVKIGATAYWNFTTNTAATIPTWTKPLTATATGVAMDRVVFESTDIARMTPFVTFANSDEFTLIIGLQIDASMGVLEDMYILQTSDSSFWLRRLPSSNGHNFFRLYIKSTSGGAFISADTSLYMKPEDGYQIWTFSVRRSTYDVRVMKGTTLDPFVKVDSLTDLGHASGNTNHNIYDWAGNIGVLYMSDQFLDLHDQTIMNRVIALDGQPPAYGADGSTVSGTQPEIYVAGDAAAWNAGSLNLGSAAQSYSMNTGTVTDFVPDVTAPTLSSPTGTATGQTTATASVSTNEDTGTIYRVTTTSGTAPTAQQVIDGEDDSGAAAAFASDQAVSATGVQTFTEASGLVAATNYYNHYMHVDFSGNRSVVRTSDMFTTNAVTYTPTWATFPANAFLKRSTDLTGAGTTQSVLFAMTYRMGADAGADTKLLYNTPSTNKFIDVYKTSGNVIGIKQKDSSNVSRVFLYVNTALSAGVDYLILYAYDGTTDGAEMRVVRLDTGVLLPNPVKATDTLGTLTTSGQFSWNIGALADAHTQQLRGNVERVQLWTNAYADVSLTATQRYFVEADGALVSPADSITAVGSTPIISISGADLTDGTNDGSGGPFAVQGVGTIVTV